MKKLLPLLVLVSLFTACEVPSEQEQIENALDEAYEDAQQEGEDFYEHNQGGSPEEVLAAKIADLEASYEADYGPASEFSGTSLGSTDKIYGHADIASQKLGLDYAQLSYVQFLSGTVGMSSLVRSMDSSAPGVAELQAMFKEYDDVTANDPDYFESIMDKGLSDDEKVAFIVSKYAEIYRVFRMPYNSGYMSSEQEADMNEIQKATGLNAEDLEVVFKYGFPELMAEAFPDTWTYKTTFIELAKY